MAGRESEAECKEHVMEPRAGGAIERARGRGAEMIDRDPPTCETLVAAITHSPIVMARAAARLPDGFEDVDVAILDWIATEGRRIGRGFVLM
jgi:hypothetical protein